MTNQEKSSMHRNTIQSLEKRAAKGSVQALYQLFDNYLSGKRVEQDDAKAKEYIGKAISILSDAKPRLKGLKLLGFRGLKDVDVNLSKRPDGHGGFVVFVGVNGSGKTAILEAITSSLSWIVQGVFSHGGSGFIIKDSDINKNSGVDYSSIVAEFGGFDRFDAVIELSKSIPGSNTSRRNNVVEARLLSSLYKEALSAVPNFNLPIFAYYSIDRAVEVSKRDIEIFRQADDIKRSMQLDGYKGSLNGSASFGIFFSWFKLLTDVANSNGKNIAKELEKILLEGDELEKIRNLVGGIKNNQELLDYLSNVVREKIKGNGEVGSGEERISKSVDLIGSAICNFIPGLSNLRVSYDPVLDLLVDKDGVALSVLQLSQGEKSLFALVADIARRLILLNPGADNPLLGAGIVLIDELDLHLHPSWQQKIATILRNTFPNVQFIASTHSPFIATTLDPDEIYILDGEMIYCSPLGTKGAASSRLSKTIFSVEERPPGIKNTQDLERYRQLVYSDEWGTEEANSLALKLREEFGNEEPLLHELDLYIEGRKWEKEIEKDK